MTVSRLLAAQLGNPSGPIGRFAARLWKRRNAALNDTALEALALQPTDRVLEIGFGGGYLLERMLSLVTEGMLAGVDISQTMVDSAEHKFSQAIDAGSLDLKCAPAEDLPFPVAHFTKACSVNSLFYWRDIEIGFKEIGRVLAPGGTLVLCFTSKSSLESRPFAQNIQLLETDEVGAMMIRQGFHDIEISDFSDRHRRFVCMRAETI